MAKPIAKSKAAPRTARSSKGHAIRGHIRCSDPHEPEYASYLFKESGRTSELRFFDPRDDSTDAFCGGKHNEHTIAGIDFSFGEYRSRLTYYRVFLTASDIEKLVKLALKNRQ